MELQRHGFHQPLAHFWQPGRLLGLRHSGPVAQSGHRYSVLHDPQRHARTLCWLPRSGPEASGANLLRSLARLRRFIQYPAAYDPSGKIADATVGIDPNHLCFIQPGASQRSEALVLEPFTGDWHPGADIYKAWRGSWFKPPNMPAWVQDVHSWQQIQINSSEDRLSFPYKDLVKYAEACKRWGVKAIQLTGWQIGRPGPRLSAARHRSPPGHCAGVQRRHRGQQSDGR